MGRQAVGRFPMTALADLDLVRDAHDCPHGRPTAVAFGRRDLERLYSGCKSRRPAHPCRPRLAGAHDQARCVTRHSYPHALQRYFVSTAPQCSPATFFRPRNWYRLLPHAGHDFFAGVLSSLPGVMIPP
jgi:hypothetical protein